MKLFSLLAGALGLAHATEEVANAAGWQDASDADTKTWKSDVLKAESTVKQIKNKGCQVPKGKSLAKLGDPTDVIKHFYKLPNGNSRSTYQFKFSDGTMVYAGNANVGQKGGNWKIYCYRQGTNLATKSAHQNDLSSAMTARLKQVFNEVDRDGSGTITSGGAYAALNKIFSASQLPEFEETLDKETLKAAGKDKKVDLDEFECVARKLYNIKKVYDEFKQYDRDNNLKMDRKELESALIKFYLKDVMKPGLIQTAVARAKVKKVVDNIMKAHDKNGDAQVSFKEFETDAFAEEHYNPGAQCKSSKTPLNKHETDVVDRLLKKFTKHGSKGELSHSEWYQITSMLTEQSIDKMNGPIKPPALGCWNPTKPTGSTNPHGGQFGSGSGTAGHYFGQNGGSHFGRGSGAGAGGGAGGGQQRPGGQRPGGQNNGGQRPGGQNNGGQRPGGQNNGGQRPGGQNNGGQRPGGQNNGGQRPGGQNNGGQRPGGQNNGGQRPGGQNNGGQRPGGQNNGGQRPGGQRPGGQNNQGPGRSRVLLRRFLQEQKPSQKKPTETKEMMSIKQALQALHEQADSNKDGKISDHEILDIFQGVRDHLTTSDFGSFLDMVNKIKGPISCGKFNDCGKCTAVGNAGLCGWFAESQQQNNNPFGGYVTKSKGNCKFVDRTRSSGHSEVAGDTAKATTCSNQCKKKSQKKGTKAKKNDQKNQPPQRFRPGN